MNYNACFKIICVLLFTFSTSQAIAIDCESEFGNCHIGFVEYPSCQCELHCMTGGWDNPQPDGEDGETEEWCLEQLEIICTTEPEYHKKPEPIDSCEDESGICYITYDQGYVMQECRCENGDAMGETVAAFIPDGDEDDPKEEFPEVDLDNLEWNCSEVLKLKCSTDYTKPEAICTEEQLETCNSMLRLVKDCNHETFGGSRRIFANQLQACCVAFGKDQKAANEHLECLKSEACIDYACCDRNHPLPSVSKKDIEELTKGESDDQSAEEETKDDQNNSQSKEDTEATGCQTTGSGGSGLVLLLLMICIPILMRPGEFKIPKYQGM